MKKPSRRAFVCACTTAAAAAAGGAYWYGRDCPTLTGVGKTPPVAKTAYHIDAEGGLVLDLNQVPELSEVGGSAKIIDSRLAHPLIVARTATDAYAVNSLRCTHRGVEVEYLHARGHFKCASLGGSTFTIEGQKMKGFATRNLTSYPVRSENGKLTIETSA
jgi:Rieske Fe-S protein